MKTLSLVPAYGRDYKSAKAVKEDWEAGKDFIIADISSKWDGRPTSIRDMAPGTQVKIRYKRLTMVTFIKTKQRSK